MPYIEPPCIELIENTIEGEDEPEVDNGEDQEDQKNWMDEFEFSLDMHEANQPEF